MSLERVLTNIPIDLAPSLVLTSKSGKRDRKMVAFGNRPGTLTRITDVTLLFLNMKERKGENVENYVDFYHESMHELYSV